MNYGNENIGGMWDALHSTLYPGLRYGTFSFSADDADPGVSVGPVSSISAEERARSFVPKLLATLARREAAEDRELTEDELDEYLHIEY